MSEKRSADIAAIDAALQFGSTPTGTAPTGGDVPGLTGPASDLTSDIIAPPPSAATPAQKEEARAKAEADKLLEKYQSEQEALELQRQSLIKRQLTDTAQATKRAIGSVQNGLGRVPIPGGLAFPLVTLLILFMLLIKINGNTRIGWLWLVMSGNAALPESTGGGPAPAPTPDTSSSTDTSTQNGVATGGGLPVLTYLPTYVPLEMDEW